MTIASRTFVANLLRNQVATTLPGGYWIYHVQSGDTLKSIVQTKVLGANATVEQVSYYVQQIVSDVRNHLSTPSDVIFSGQVIYIPKRVG